MECHMRAMLTPSANDRPELHSDVPVSELTERDTRAIKASVVSSAPLVAETKDGVTHEIWPTPTVGVESDQHVNICSFVVRCDRMWPSTQ